MAEQENRFDVIVIGSGPGGYSAAIRASQLGLKSAVVEKEALGGICLNWGCIPTKALLESAHLLEKIKKAREFGLSVQDPSADFGTVIDRSRRVANRMSMGVDYLMKKNNITVINGEARFKSPGKLEIHSSEDGKETVAEYEATDIIIATGARARALPGLDFDGSTVLDYRSAMSLEKAPGSLAVIGAGAIGVEFADFYRSMGSEVTIFEMLPQLLPIEDEEVSKALKKSFDKRGIRCELSISESKVEKTDRGIKIQYKNKKDEDQSAEFDAVLVAIGIQANTENLGLDLSLEKDRIKVDERYATNVPGIYAIGDCIPGPALAHVASHEAIRAAEAIYLNRSGKDDIHYEPIDYDIIPSCTYCHPEVASIGKTEQQLKDQGIEYSKGQFPFTASGRGRAAGDTDGFCKILSGKKHGRILGVHIVGPGATEMIAEMQLGMEAELVTENFARTMHPHPTLSEAVMEAAAQSLGESINI
ncbi:MAG TPA: dihydrolipoyl dehydrogenase [Leptospiraceae bacterium]|nr:dihydrolipoyl dehydrogenase [Spirochaetaceae bacterium]HBS04983.1 dihydrolipoyl dehydrogenase [Leptospiraceae bacterium]|tara:strand:+ start:31607 stop:33034 length:1428 start_codon:yes stop_codon:yes gene_type:complete